MSDNRIYLDNAATTAMDQRVMESILPFLTSGFGNASSLHTDGVRARNAVEAARQQIAATINAAPEELYFTSGGTESNNWALKGIAFANREKGNHIIVSSIEHDCVLNTCRWLKQNGFRITYLPVGCEGIVDPQKLKKWITPETILISVMHANNELGTIQPIGEIGMIARERNILFHTDACQSFGKIPLDVRLQNIDLMTINAHKIYGPKGVGALYVKRNVPIEPLLHGGGQEHGMRSTTENVAGIVGFAKAVELCMNEMSREAERLSSLVKRLACCLEESIEGVYFNGSRDHRLPGYLNFGISGMEGDSIRLLLLLDDQGVSVSTGSACSSNAANGVSSHVLQAIGRNPLEARGAIRITLGRFNTGEEIDSFCRILINIHKELNSIFS